jgi:hypothetical protein
METIKFGIYESEKEAKLFSLPAGRAAFSFFKGGMQ